MRLLRRRPLGRRRVVAVVTRDVEVGQMHCRVAPMQLQLAEREAGMVFERAQVVLVVRVVERRTAEPRQCSPDTAGREVLDLPVVFVQTGAFAYLGGQQ